MSLCFLLNAAKHKVNQLSSKQKLCCGIAEVWKRFGSITSIVCGCATHVAYLSLFNEHFLLVHLTANILICDWQYSHTALLVMLAWK